MLVADGAQAFQVTLRRDEHAGRAGDRFDDAGGDGFGAVQRHQPLEIIGKFGAVLRLALDEGVLGEVVGVAKVVRTGKLREDAAVVEDAADRNAAKADTVIAALAADQAGAGALANRALVGDRDFQRRVDRFGTGAGEEHAIKLLSLGAGGDLRKAFGEVEGDRVAHLEGGGEIHG
ncbi:hypothetical protein D9M70_545290 [compost metagenome]